MHHSQLDKLCCISCHLNCEILPVASIRTSQCLERQYCIWPGGNNFFQEGIYSILTEKTKCHLGRGFIFIDFAYYNLSLLSKRDWLTYLIQSRLPLILVADKRMAPLATYWQRQFDEILAVIYSDNDRRIINNKISKAICGLTTRQTCRKQLTEFEVAVLQYLMSGCSIKDICQKLATNRNSIYNVRRSLKNKMGDTINNLITY